MRTKKDNSRFLPLLAALSVMAVAFFMWLAISEKEQTHLEARIRLKAQNIRSEILGRTNPEILALVRMAKRWETAGQPPKNLWESDASLYIEHNPVYQAIEWVDPSFHVRWIAPLKGNEKARDLDLSFEENRKTALEEAWEKRKATITRPVDLIQGGKGFLVFAPIFREERFEGLILGVFRIEKLLNAILHERIVEGVSVALYDGDQKIYESAGAGGKNREQWSYETDVTFENVTWRLSVWPTPEFLSSEKSHIPEIALAFGTLSAFFLAYMIRLSQKAQRHGAEVASINLELEREIIERRQAEKQLKKDSAHILLLQKIADIANQDKSIEETLQFCLDRICETALWPVGHVYFAARDSLGRPFLSPSTVWHMDEPAKFKAFREITEKTPLGWGEGLPGRVLADRNALWIIDATKDSNFPRAKLANIEVKAGFGFPVLVGEEVAVVMEFFSNVAEAPDEKLLEVMSLIGVQLGRVIERKRASDSILESRNYARAIVSHIVDGVVVIGETGVIRDFNPAAERIFGYPASEILGKNVNMLMPEPYRSEHDAYLKKYLQTGKSKIIGIGREAIGLRHDGRVFPIDLEISETYQGDQRIFVGSVRDVTARKEMEERLRRLSSAVEQSPSAILMTGVSGEIEYVNPSFLDATGYEAEEVIGKTPRILKSGIHPPEFYEKLWKELLAGNAWKGDFCNRKKNGELYWALQAISPIRNSLGEITHFISVTLDDTERKRAEESLQKTNLFLKSILDSPSDTSIVSTDMEGNILFWNKGAENMLGYRAGEMLGKKISSLYSDEETKKIVRKAVAYITAHKRGIGCEIRETTKRGEKIWVKLTLSPKLDESGDAVGILGIGENVTHRKMAEERLLASEERLRLIIDTASDAFISIDATGTVTEWNAQAEKMFGWAREDAIERRLADLIVPKKLREAHKNGIRRFLETGQSKVLGQRIELSALRRDGSEFPVELSISPLRYRDSYIFNAFVQDISQRKFMQTQLTHAQKMESIGQLSAGIAHEINTPMQYIGDNIRFLHDAFKDLMGALGEYGKLLENGKGEKLPAAALESVETAVRQADLGYLTTEIPQAIKQSLEGVGRVTKIVQAMKEFSHPGTEGKQFADINKMLETTVTVSRNEWKYVANIETDFDPDLPMVPCLADDMHQVFLNIIVNAAHAIGDVVGKNESKKGAITIATRRAGDWVETRIKDSGTGIPEEARPRIFDPFFTTKEVGKGTGQGLSIVHAVVVKKHGGTVSFETEMGKGTTFIIRLPVSPPQEKKEP